MKKPFRSSEHRSVIKNTQIDEQYAQIIELRKKIETITGASGDTQEEIDEARAQVEEARTVLQTLLIDLNEKQVKAEVVVQKKEQAQAEAESRRLMSYS